MSGERVSYAVYSRRQPEIGILAKLTPSDYKIIYTPNGVKEFNLNQNKLPLYHDFLAKYLPQRSKYVFIEYEKGRSVEKSVSLFPDINIPKIIDIDTSKSRVNTEKLGDRGQVERLEAFIQAEIGGRQKTVHLSKRLDLEHTMTLYDIGTLDVEYYFVSSSNNPNRSGHMEAMIITRNEVEIFDPNGKTDNYDFSEWAQELADIINERDGTNRKVVKSYDTLACPQILANKTVMMNDQEYGDCTIWSYYYLWLRIKNPTVSRDDIIYYMQHLPPLVMKSKSKLISGLINDTRPNLTLKLGNKTITYDLNKKYFWIGFYQMCVHFGMDEKLFPPYITEPEPEFGSMMGTEYDTSTHLPLIGSNIKDVEDYARGSITALRVYKPEINSITIRVVDKMNKNKLTRYKFTIRN